MYNTYYYGLAQKAANVAGYPIQPLWIYAQWMHETDGFTSPLCRECHNLGGITQVAPNLYPQPDGDLFYMQFSSDYEFAEYFGRYLRLYREDGLFDSIDMDEYVMSLQRGGYFGANYYDYIGGMRKWLCEKN